MPRPGTPPSRAGAHRAGDGLPFLRVGRRPQPWPGAAADRDDTAAFLGFKVDILRQAGQLKHIEPGVLRLAADRVDPAGQRVIDATLPSEHPARSLIIEAALLLARSRPRTAWLPRTEQADLGHPIPWTAPAETEQATSEPGPPPVTRNGWLRAPWPAQT